MSVDEVNQQLLQSLKDTVEGLLISQLSNVWNVYGGLNRLHNAIEKIFSCQCKNFDQEGYPDYWVFIQGLNWLQPSLAVSPSLTSNETGLEENLAQLPSEVIGKASSWLYKSLESHTLSQKLAWLLSDREHLTSCYENKAYLSLEKYGEATLICLKAVEQNQSSLLAEIDPSLYLPKWDYKTFQKTHRRCSSLPETKYAPWHFKRQRALQTMLSEDSSRYGNDQSAMGTFFDKPVAVESARNDNETCTVVQGHPAETEIGTFVSDKTKVWKSLPCLYCVETCDVLLKRSISWTDATKGCSLSRGIIINSSIGSKPNTSTVTIKLSPSLLSIDYKGLKSTSPMVENEQLSPQKTSTVRHLKNKPVNLNAMKSTVHSSFFEKQSTTSALKGSDKNDSVSQVFGPTVMNSDSSDTLNVESKSSDSSESNNSLKPCVRPSELNLAAKTWEHKQYPAIRGTQSASNIRVQDTKRRKSRAAGSAPESDSPLRTYRKSFIEDGGSSVLPMSTGFFPKPMEGQSLTSFLSSGQFARPSAELDRENAHFSISEAMIAAIEQVKCNRRFRLAEETGEVGDESDEEINHLKQRIRLRRCQRQREKQRHSYGVTLLSDGKTDTTTTDQSVTPTSSSPGSTSESISTDDVDDLEVDEVKNLSQLKHAGLSMSMASLYSEADLSKPPRIGLDPLTESIVSAEGVALSLLRQFKEKQLPRASDLQWLVSEQDAPQELLPLPKSWPVSPDEAEDSDMRQATPLRGTVEWAPPRPQVIFTLHPSPVRRILMAKQNSRCAGCGMKVAPEYAHKFRYCEYLGRYFCTGCHTNQLALIPGRVLVKWDFTRKPVSTFSYRLLDQMSSDPLFCISDVNPGLYRKARQLERTRQLRIQLNYLKDFVLTCRFAKPCQDELNAEPAYYLTEQDVYSMQDLVQVKSGELADRLRGLIVSSSQHVAECHLCQARGFVCELCSSREVIYPWQLSKVTRCVQCGACFHNSCWRPGHCPRCQRLSTRKLSRETQPLVA